MDVKNGNREDQPPSQRAEPAPYPVPGSDRPSADGMIGPVDGFEERLEMSGRPGLDGRCDQHERMCAIVKRGADHLIQTRGAPIQGDSPDCDGAPGGLYPGDDGRNNGFGQFRRLLGQKDYQDSRAQERVTGACGRYRDHRRPVSLPRSFQPPSTGAAVARARLPLASQSWTAAS